LIFTLNFALASSSKNLIKIIGQCYPVEKIRQQVMVEQKLHQSLKGPALSLSLISGYTNNEISSANPERFQLGARVRWEDITDQQKRGEYQDALTSTTLEQSKVLIENYWRIKLRDLYYWKWGQSLTKEAKKFLDFTKKKLSSSEESFGSLATTRIYSDILTLNHTVSEFLAKMNVLEKEFENCSGLKSWEEKLDFDEKEMTFFSAKMSNRIVYQAKLCTAQKKIKSINLKREAGTWGINLNSSMTQNKQLGGEGNQFNDMRAGLEITIPIQDAKAEEVQVASCDYDTKLLQDEDLIDRSVASSLYPTLKMFQVQFEILKKRILDVNFSSKGIQTQDVIQLGLNYFHLHNSLSNGEAKINARILPSKIVENEF
jgi:hypothetical protein